MVMLRFVWAVALDVLSTLGFTWEGGIALPLTILALGDAQVYIGTFNGGNKAFYIEVFIDEFLHFATTLDVPDINLYDYHIQLG